MSIIDDLIADHEAEIVKRNKRIADLELQVFQMDNSITSHHWENTRLRYELEQRDDASDENKRLREALEKISAYAPCSGIKDPGYTKMYIGILARDTLAGITNLDAKTAADMLDNPGEPNQAMVDLLKLK